ncbi:MAG: hypothetical protein K2P57_08855 [Burkholderiales bacterium]|nr:hypothetical protein [Burkholderiales bacterium]
MQATIGFEGKHAALASSAEISAGIDAADKVFSMRNARFSDCAAANEKLERGELLSREEALLCLVWDEAEEAAFHAITLGWLSRDVDIRLSAR